MKRILNLLWMLLPMWLFAGNSQLEVECGKQYKVTAVAEEGSRFVRWSDGVTANPRIVTATEDKTFTAIFENIPGQETCPYSGTCGDNLTWELSCEGVLTISGTGAIEDYCGNMPPDPYAKIPGDSKPVPWESYISQIIGLQIAEGVTGIGSCAFSGLGLTGEVTIPSSVKAIGDNAFSNCSSLSQIVFASVTPPTIGYGCFDNSNCTFSVPCDSKEDYVKVLAVGAGRVAEPEMAFTYSITAANSAQGSVTITQEPTCADMSLAFSATAAAGFVFRQWSDGVTVNPRTIILTQDTVITAEFEQVEQGTVIIRDGEEKELDQIGGNEPVIIVEAGGELIVSESDSRAGVITVISAGSKSGQVQGADNLGNRWRIIMEYTLNPIGQTASPDLWYAFDVPFEVDIATGITRATGDESHISGTDFLILEYDGQLRAETTRGWVKKLSGTLEPGTFYMIGIKGNCNRWLFEKKNGAAVQGDAVVNLAKYVAGNSGNDKHNGWNGKGNTRLEYTNISFSGCDINYLVMYDNTISDYVTTDLSNIDHLCVGQSFFIQAPNAENMSFSLSAIPNHMPALLARKETTPLMRFTLGSQQVAYPLYLSLHEEATAAYTIGRDVMRMDGGNKNIAKFWFTANDGTELSAHGIAMPETETVVPVTLFAPTNGEYLINMSSRAMDDYEVELLHNGAWVATLNAQPVSLSLSAGSNSGYSVRIVRRAQTDIENVQSDKAQSTKVLINGQMYILRSGHMYSAQGAIVK